MNTAPPHLEYPDELLRLPTVEVARGLIGCELWHASPEGIAAGRIVETEAYGPDDPASHAFHGPNRRNGAMFGPPGSAYVYRSYGVHWCLNVVTCPCGIGEAVLVRALEPIVGSDLMARRRRTDNDRLWCSGPGRLTEALNVSGLQDGAMLGEGALRLGRGPASDARIACTPRIGITRATERMWRFVDASSRYLSRSLVRRRCL